VAVAALDRQLGLGTSAALADAGAADLDGGALTGRFCVLRVGRALAVVPRRGHGAGDPVYLGPDTAWFLQALWKLAAGGRRAVELGTGTGLIAAALSPRYELMVGTDVVPTTIDIAALTFWLNRDLARGRTVAVLADVASGLRPRSFDLVVANAPWVPSAMSRPNGGRRRFADGGPTGQELPIRFLVEGVELLAPGGVAVVQCLDLVYDDGQRPLVDVCRRLRASGCRADLQPVGPAALSASLNPRLREAGVPAQVTLVDVIVERPERP